MCPPRATMYQQHAAAVRQAGLATLKATNNAHSTAYPSITGVMTSDELIRATESLYDDRIRPLSRILKRRLVELSGDSNLRTVDIDLRALRVAVAAAAPRLTASPAEGGDWEAVLTDRPSNFVDVHDECDSYGEQFWQDFVAYIGLLRTPKEYRLPSSRYACAFELRARKLPFLADLSLGSLCHVVQLAISHKKILGHRDGALVPYILSKCFEKKQHAELGMPQSVSATSCETANMPFADWAAVRACMIEIMNLARHSEQGCEPLANIKRLFRSRYHLELSETLLGCTKLSEVLQSPQVVDLCSLEMRNSGCCVVPAPFWNTFDSSTNLKGRDCFGGLFPEWASKPQNSLIQMPWQLSPSRESSIGSSDFLEGLLLDLEPEDSSMSGPLTSHLSSSRPSDTGNITSMVKNTFIEHPDASTVQREGARRRTRSVPKNMGSTKNNWETTCHALTYQHQSVTPPETIASMSMHKIILKRKGCGLGLDVSCEGEPGSECLLIEDVGPGPVELWNLSHLGEIMVQAGDRILEVNGVAGDANAMLCAVQASDTVELTLHLSSRSAGATPRVRGPGPQTQEVHMHMVPGPMSRMQMAPEHAMPCQVPASAPQMPMVHAPLMPLQLQTQLPPCPVPAPQSGGQVFIHSGPPKIFIHSAQPQLF